MDSSFKGIAGDFFRVKQAADIKPLDKLAQEERTGKMSFALAKQTRRGFSALLIKEGKLI